MPNTDNPHAGSLQNMMDLMFLFNQILSTQVLGDETTYDKEWLEQVTYTLSDDLDRYVTIYYYWFNVLKRDGREAELNDIAILIEEAKTYLAKALTLINCVKH